MLFRITLAAMLLFLGGLVALPAQAQHGRGHDRGRHHHAYRRPAPRRAVIVRRPVRQRTVIVAPGRRY